MDPAQLDPLTSLSKIEFWDVARRDQPELSWDDYSRGWDDYQARKAAGLIPQGRLN